MIVSWAFWQVMTTFPKHLVKLHTVLVFAHKVFNINYIQKFNINQINIWSLPIRSPEVRKVNICENVRQSAANTVQTFTSFPSDNNRKKNLVQ